MDRNFVLENGIYCEGKSDNFRLLYKGYVLTPSCSNIAYVQGKLIAVKSKNAVFIYKPRIRKGGGQYTLIQLAMFETYDSSAYLKINIQGHLYIIDSNVQIKICECPKLS